MKSVLFIIALMFLFTPFIGATPPNQHASKRSQPSRCGEHNSNHLITEQQALAIWNLLQAGHTSPQVAKITGISIHIVRAIKYGKRWTCVTGLSPKSLPSSASAAESALPTVVCDEADEQAARTLMQMHTNGNYFPCHPTDPSQH